jgi:protein-S-isoprenylcysteine O-methyltransferase Ste14
LATNLAVLAAFLVLHSVMARPAFKARWTRLISPALERATYILVSGITTFAMVWAWQPLPQTLWLVEHPASRLALQVGYAVGWLTIVLATFNIDHFSFFGLRQAWDHMLGRAAHQVPFTARFLYGVVRHPISLGWVILFWSTPHMTVGHLLFAGCMTAYIALVTPIEEADLVAALGDDYIRYRRRVRAFIPWKASRS